MCTPRRDTFSSHRSIDGLWFFRIPAIIDGRQVEREDFDDMVGMFQSLLPALDDGEARVGRDDSSAEQFPSSA